MNSNKRLLNHTLMDQVRKIDPTTDNERDVQDALLKIAEGLAEVEVVLTNIVDADEFLSPEYEEAAGNLVTSGMEAFAKLHARTVSS